MTVVIATYNWAAVLPYSIRSVLDQTFEDFELMVVGDGCTDDSADVVASFADPRVRWLNLAVNTRHQSGPNNEAIRRSDSELIAYLGHDDLWLPNHLDTLVGAVAETGLAHASTLLVRPDGRAKAYPRGNWCHRDSPWLPPTSVVHSRKLVTSAGGWRSPRETGVLDAETELWLRLSDAAGRPPTWIRKVTSVKLPAALRPGVYRERPHHEQQAWLDRIRRGESWDELVPSTWRTRSESAAQWSRRSLGRESWRRRLRRPPATAPTTAEQRWRSLREEKGLE